MSRSTESENEKSFLQQPEENKESPLFNDAFSDNSYQSMISSTFKTESDNTASRSLPGIDLFDSKDKADTGHQEKNENSDHSNETFKLPTNDSKDSLSQVKAEPYEIELPSKTMPFALFGSPTEHFPSLGKDIKMPPAETGAKVDFTLKRQVEGGYCLTAKSGNKEWVLKDGVFSSYWKETGK
ncbi:MAG: hypothetical protein K2X27_16690 [Candidatus Obscuribacterales bacterium]|nr:hypothetical protein [Candidatus Obscuribacterales bacterium]